MPTFNWAIGCKYAIDGIVHEVGTESNIRTIAKLGGGRSRPDKAIATCE